MSATLTKEEVSIIAFKTAIQANRINSLRPEKENPIFIDDACELTGYSKATIYSLVHKKEMPFHKAAGRRRLYFVRSEILSWMATGSKAIQQKEVAV